MRLLCILVLGFIAQEAMPGALRITRDVHPAVLSSSVLHIPEPRPSSAFSTLMRVGVLNHLPIGVVIGPGKQESMCVQPFEIGRSDVSVGELLGLFNTSERKYEATLENGVFVIKPTSLAPTTAKLLKLRVDNFKSDPEPHNILGSDLWIFVRAIIAPGEGSIGGGANSSLVDRVPAVNIPSGTVESILNAIVDKGNGGVWILHEAMIQKLDSEAPRPYEVYGYVGQENFVRSGIPCSLS